MTQRRRRLLAAGEAPRGGRAENERGTALVEFVWLAILLLIPLVYVVLAVLDTQRTAFAASAAARSAGRAFLTAPSQTAGYARARIAARTAFHDQGVEDGFEVRITCRPRPGDCLTPGSTVTAEVRARAVLPLMPAVFGRDAPGIRVDSVHSAPYGTFREARP